MDFDTFIATMKAGMIHEEFDPETGLHTKWQYDPLTEKVVGIVTATNHKQTLIENQKIRAESASHWRGDFHRVARIPNLAAYNHCQQRGITTEEFLKDPVEMKKFINEPENKSFRLKNGRI